MGLSNRRMYIRQIIVLKEDGVTPSDKVFVEGMEPGVVHQDEVTYAESRKGEFKSNMFETLRPSDKQEVCDAICLLKVKIKKYEPQNVTKVG